MGVWTSDIVVGSGGLAKGGDCVSLSFEVSAWKNCELATPTPDSGGEGRFAGGLKDSSAFESASLVPSA